MEKTETKRPNLARLTLRAITQSIKTDQIVLGVTDYEIMTFVRVAFITVHTATCKPQIDPYVVLL